MLSFLLLQPLTASACLVGGGVRKSMTGRTFLPVIGYKISMAKTVSRIKNAKLKAENKTT